MIRTRGGLARVGGLAAFTLLWPASATAQVVWDAPALMRPGSPSGLSVLLLDAHPSDELGVLAMWRRANAPMGVGLRGGVAEEDQGDLAAMFGLDFSGSLTGLGSAGNPDVMWWAGVGVGVGDELVASFPLGLVLGWQAGDESVTVWPYVGGHVSLDFITGPGDDLDLDGSLDLGLDLGFRSGWMIRFGASVGGRDALGIGVRLPT